MFIKSVCFLTYVITFATRKAKASSICSLDLLIAGEDIQVRGHCRCDRAWVLKCKYFVLTKWTLNSIRNLFIEKDKGRFYLLRIAAPRKAAGLAAEGRLSQGSNMQQHSSAK